MRQRFASAGRLWTEGKELANSNELSPEELNAYQISSSATIDTVGIAKIAQVIQTIAEQVAIWESHADEIRLEVILKSWACPRAFSTRTAVCTSAAPSSRQALTTASKGDARVRDIVHYQHIPSVHGGRGPMQPLEVPAAGGPPVAGGVDIVVG